MKKIIPLLLAVMLLLAGCSNNYESSIKNNWMLSRVTNSSTGEVIFCTDDNKPFYEDAKIIDLSCTADETKIKIIDNATSEAWSLEYSLNETVQTNNSNTSIYDIFYYSDNQSLKGYATIGKSSSNEDYLILSLNGYSIYFDSISETE